MDLAKGWIDVGQRIPQTKPIAKVQAARRIISLCCDPSQQTRPKTVSRPAQTEQPNHQQQALKGQVPQELSHLGSVL